MRRCAVHIPHSHEPDGFRGEFILDPAGQHTCFPFVPGQDSDSLPPADCVARQFQNHLYTTWHGVFKTKCAFSRRLNELLEQPFDIASPRLNSARNLYPPFDGPDRKWSCSRRRQCPTFGDTVGYVETAKPALNRANRCCLFRGRARPVAELHERVREKTKAFYECIHHLVARAYNRNGVADASLPQFAVRLTHVPLMHRQLPTHGVTRVADCNNGHTWKARQ